MIAPEALTLELEEAGVAWATLGMERGSAHPRDVARLRRILREWRPSVVHSHMIHANLLARAARTVTRMPVLLCTAHNVDEGGKARMLAYRLTDPLCDRTTNVSVAAVERYVRIRAVPRRKISFMPNGIDPEKFRPRPELRSAVRHELGLGDEFVWLGVGRFEEQKDYPTMLRAFAEVLGRCPHNRLLLVGEGALQEELIREHALLGFGDAVRFLGVRADVADLLNAADAYLMSSAWEGMPIVLLEAAATALPIVATDVGGNREVVRHGESGLLVEPGDPRALAAAMSELLARPAEVRRRMGEHGRTYVVETYDLGRIAARWEALYEYLLSRKGVALDPDEDDVSIPLGTAHRDPPPTR